LAIDSTVISRCSGEYSSRFEIRFSIACPSASVYQHLARRGASCDLTVELIVLELTCSDSNTPRVSSGESPGLLRVAAQPARSRIIEQVLL